MKTIIFSHLTRLLSCLFFRPQFPYFRKKEAIFSFLMAYVVHVLDLCFYLSEWKQIRYLTVFTVFTYRFMAHVFMSVINGHKNSKVSHKFYLGILLKQVCENINSFNGHVFRFSHFLHFLVIVVFNISYSLRRLVIRRVHI